MAGDAALFSALAQAPPAGAACWTRTSDNIMIRVAYWPEGSRGTVLIFPGRTEAIEKYGRVVRDLAQKGLASVVVDWRGQGLSERRHYNRRAGHVSDFAEYQYDVAALFDQLQNLKVTQPIFLLAHSMGGAIGLRALSNGLPIKAAAFCAPMWGIKLNTIQKSLIYPFATAGVALGFGHRFAPGTGPKTEPSFIPFEQNLLTRDPETYQYLITQLAKTPQAITAGPTISWVKAALKECRDIIKITPPKYPTLIGLGDAEGIVCPAAIHEMAEKWPAAKLEIFPGAKHELLMEIPSCRDAFLDAVVTHFFDHAGQCS